MILPSVIRLLSARWALKWFWLVLQVNKVNQVGRLRRSYVEGGAGRRRRRWGVLVEAAKDCGMNSHGFPLDMALAGSCSHIAQRERDSDARGVGENCGSGCD